MPQANTPGTKKKKKGRAPKHQNTFAFRHNPKSKKTEKILASPNVGVCRRCHDKIEWRKKYRKYKPRTQPGKCNICSQKNVMAAYHTICTPCAGGAVAIAAMEKHRSGPNEMSTNRHQDEDTDGDSTHSHEDVDEATRHPVGTASISPQGSNASIAAKPRTNLRTIRVCAMCTQEPALSKYDNRDGEGVGELVARIQELEYTLESGMDAADGRKLTLREVKGMERQLEKLRLEAKENGKKKKKTMDTVKGEESEGESDDEDDSDDGDSEQSEEEEEDDDDPNDPFLLAVGGKDKLLVGEEYQNMLLAKEKQRQG